MSHRDAFFALQLLGPFRLLDPDGRRIDVTSRKSQALIAMLAMSAGGERTRSWLQGQLWGSRGQDQAQSSLRSEISKLRGLINSSEREILHADHIRIWLDMEYITVDARGSINPESGEFLEGLDIPGEDSFEDWLRQERARLFGRAYSNTPVFSTEEPAVVSKTNQVFSGLPALAVLPFANHTGDPQNDFLAEGISEDLIDRLSRLRWLPIIARSSSFAVRETNPDPKIVGKSLGARYLLDGRVRHQGDVDILSASLMDCQTSKTIWSSRVSLSAEDGVDNLLTSLAATLGAKIDMEEQSKALRKPQSDLNVRELIWRGRWHLNRFTADDAVQANACFSEALAREPNSPEAIIQMTWSKLWDLWARRGSDDEIRVVRQMAQKAIIADYDDARGHMLAGIAEKWLRQPLRSEALLQRAIELNPSLAMAYAQLGGCYYLRDTPKEAVTMLKSAIRLSPNDADIFHFRGELAMAFLMNGALEDALEQADLSLMRRGAYWFSHIVKINALIRSGNGPTAYNAFLELKSSNPRFGPHFIDWIPFMDARWNRFLSDGLNQVLAEND
jgi:TolB-like protein